jgi:hypothetical protein
MQVMFNVRMHASDVQSEHPSDVQGDQQSNPAVGVHMRRTVQSATSTHLPRVEMH